MKILIGVTGGIAAYKAAGLVRAFKKRGDEVRVVMTRGATQFITPMTLQVLSEQPVGLDLFDAGYEHEIGHIEMARWPDIVLVAPATAQAIARMAHGFADDLLTTILVATTAPVLVAPAMNTQMYRHPAVTQNMQRLEQVCGYHLLAPDSGELACKEVGPGRLPDPDVVVDAVDRVLSPKPLAGKRVLITAGPTREHIDPARFISNPSSGKMGYALAHVASMLGADVTLVSGPVALEAPAGVRRVSVESAQQMFDAVISRAPQQDVVVKVAAVCDWRPTEPSARKRAKSEMNGDLELTRTPDILATLCERFGVSGDSGGPLVVGFAAESHDVQARGRAKMKRKGAHALVANLIGGPGSTFGADHSTAHVLFAHNEDVVACGPAPKSEVAAAIWSALEPLIRNHSSCPPASS